MVLLLGSTLLRLYAQHTLATGWWRASLQRQDGKTIDFNFEVVNQKSTQEWYIRNAGERIRVSDIQWDHDSLLVHMPVFESQFRLHYEKAGVLRGLWIRATSSGEQVMPVTAQAGESKRFPGPDKAPGNTVTGRWDVTFADNNNTEKAIGEFKQNGNHLTGTFLTTTGDYRYLEGTVRGDSLQLSTFDGSHAYYFVAHIRSNTSITNGMYYSGAKGKESWTAVKDESVTLPDTASAVYLKKGEDKLHFKFPDLDSNLISINGPRFKNKVVVIQIMGSWCPNCMDETAFLSSYYNQNKSKGVEMIGLAYEYSSDFQRSKKSLLKFKKRFNIQYPILITGVRVSDSLRTEKTLPEVTEIKMFPTTIFIGRDGKVKKIDNGFNGPGTGIHYTEFKKDFDAEVKKLLGS